MFACATRFASYVNRELTFAGVITDVSNKGFLQNGKALGSIYYGRYTDSFEFLRIFGGKE